MAILYGIYFSFIQRPPQSSALSFITPYTYPQSRINCCLQAATWHIPISGLTLLELVVNFKR